MEVDREKLFTVLMSEKEHADAQIRSYMDLQSKSTGIVFVALTAAVGWIFASRQAPLDPHDRGLALIIIVLIAAFSIIYGAFTYCAALGYMWYKDRHVIPALHELIGREPPRASAAFAESPANRVVRRLAAAFNLLLALGCFALVIVVSRMSREVPVLGWWVAAAIPVLALALFAGWDTARAILATLGPGRSAAREERPTDR